MVSLKSTTSGFILRDIFAALTERVKDTPVDTIEYAFMCWIYPALRDHNEPILPSDFSVSNYSHVAQLAFLTEVNPILFADQQPSLTDGLNRTSARAATITGVGPAGFYSDAIALIGLALGAKRLGGDTIQEIGSWMDSFARIAATSLPPWKKTLIIATLDMLDKPVANSTGLAADIELALTSRGIDSFPQIDLDHTYQEICTTAIKDDIEPPAAAAKLQAIDYLIKHIPAISINKPTIQQLTQVLENITPAFRRWVWESAPKTPKSTTQRWDIQNEYHVQSLLYFLLTPLFPNIEDEFYLETTGLLNPRADIGLPSLNLIIEVKFLRAGKSFQKIQEEIAADTTLYFKKESVYKDKYTKMLVFLWDDSNRTQEHGTFKNGVRAFNNVADIVVITRPGIIGTHQKAI